MFWRWFLLFCTFSFAYCCLFLMLFWHLKLVVGQELFGIQFGSHWTFRLFYVMLLTPVVLTVNFLINTAYYFGKIVWVDIFRDKFWIIHLTNSSATIFSLLVLTWLCFGEVPSKGTLAGFILAIAAVLVSVFWK